MQSSETSKSRLNETNGNVCVRNRVLCRLARFFVSLIQVLAVVDVCNLAALLCRLQSPARLPVCARVGSVVESCGNVIVADFT